MIRFIVDSTAYAPKEYLEAHRISVVPLSVFVRDREYVEGAPGTFAPVYEDCARSKVIPTTSLPSRQAFLDAFNAVTKDGEEAVCLTISSTLSGTYNNARLAAGLSEHADRISVLDSGSAAQEIFLLLQDLVEMAEQGCSRAQIAEALPSLREKVGIVFVPETLENLRRGGRISLISAALGDILKIKPVLQFKEGVLSCAKKVLGSAMAIAAVLDRIPKAAVRKIGVLKVSACQQFERLKDKIRAKFPNTPLFEGDIGPVIGAHVGPAFGLCWITA